MDTRFLLLRGVNVGGHRRVPMADRRSLLGALGCEDVVTYLQSGNAVCRSDLPVGRLASVTEGALQTELGVTVRVVARSSDQWATTVSGNPLLGLDDDPTRLHVVFLESAPDRDRRDALVTEATAFAPERLVVSGHDAYLHTPDGYHRAKLNHALLERRLGLAATARNWRTVVALADLAGVTP